MRHRLSALVVGTLGAAVVATAHDAHAEDLCAALAIPEPLDLVCREQPDGTTVVRGPDSPFPSLNRLELRRLDAPVDDPAAWLRDRSTLDTSGISETLRGWLTHPDNPLKPEVVEPSLEALTEALGQIEELSQTVCDEPEELAPDRWTMRCRFELTVAEGVLRLELFDAAGQPVAAEMRAASEQRARQFEALLNGFDPSG
ncbi:MAG: hypothetical protein ACLFU0_03575 [Alphaproteobacteria bacterium]